jgi:hypothetical protein
MKKVWVVSKLGHVQVICETEDEARVWVKTLDDDKFEIQCWLLNFRYGVYPMGANPKYTDPRTK